MTCRQELVGFNTINGLQFPEIQKYTIVHFWEMYGGSFLTGLASALSSADIINEKKIRDNWSAEIEQYMQELIKYEDTLWD